MSAKVLQLRPLFRPNGWSSRELSEFYRVEAVLVQSGIGIDTESGISDEGDPWFAFCRKVDGEVIVHIARIGGVYILASPSFEDIASGSDINLLVRDLVAHHPLIQMQGRNKGSNIFLHPAALLTAIVATAFFKTSEARALTDLHRSENRSGGASGRSEAHLIGENQKTVIMDAAQSAVILMAVAEAVHDMPLPLMPSDWDLAAISAPPVGSSDSDLVDYSAPIMAAHVATDVSMPIAFGDAQDPYGLAGVGAKAEAAADAFPLIVIVWDLAKSPSGIVARPEGEHLLIAAEQPTNSFTTSIIETVTLAVTIASPTGPGVVMPIIKCAEISFAGKDGVVNHDFLKADGLPAALIKALQSSIHSSIGTQAKIDLDASFATALIASLKEEHADLTSQGLVSAPIKEQPASVLSAADSHAVDKAPSDSATSLSPNVNDVQKLVQDFIANVSDWHIFENDHAVVIYDNDALHNNPNALTSVTFDFSDGSALSLVGLPADMPHPLLA